MLLSLTGGNYFLKNKEPKIYPNFTGNIYIKRIFDLGGKINIEKSINNYQKSLKNYGFEIKREFISLAMAFHSAESIYEERFPILIDARRQEFSTNLECLEGFFLRIHPSGVISVNFQLKMKNQGFPSIKETNNRLMNEFEKENQSITLNNETLYEYIKKLIAKISRNTVFIDLQQAIEKNESNYLYLRQKIGKNVSLGVSTIYMPTNLTEFKTSEQFLDQFGSHTFANLFIKSKVDESKALLNIIKDPIIRHLRRRYIDELLFLGRHSIFIFCRSRGEKFIYKAEFVYELARVQKFLAKIYSNLTRMQNERISRLIADKDVSLKTLEKEIVRINTLRNRILTNTATMMDYPSFIVNMHLINLFEETLNIGYGDVEYENLMENLRSLEELVRSIYDIQKIKHEKISQKELTLLNLVFIIGIVAQLIAFLTKEYTVVISSIIWIIISVIFGFGLFFILHKIPQKQL